MADNELNSLERFRKKSPKLILEQHSHCEVPAGCGGVVLRWRNPLSVLPLRVYLFAPAKSRLYVDGRLLETTGLDLEPGPHVCSIEIEETDLASGLFQFVALHDPDRGRKEMPAGISEGFWKLVSAPDGNWRAATEQPPQDEQRDWSTLDFDDSAWIPLTRAVAQPEVPSGQEGSYQAHWCKEHKAQFVALTKASGRGRVWVRRKFVVPLPKTEQGGKR